VSPNFSLLHGYTEAPGIVSFVEPDDDVIGVSDHYHIACGIATSPLMRPQIEDVVEVYVCQRGEIPHPVGAFLRCSPLTSSDVPAVSHLRMSLITLRSPIRCSVNLISHSWLTLSKN
jgi:hypothetical protein